MKSSTQTLIAAMRILADEIDSEDGVANAVIREAAQRLEGLSGAHAWSKEPPNVFGWWLHHADDDFELFKVYMHPKTGRAISRYHGGIGAELDCAKYGGWWLEFKLPSPLPKEVAQ